MKKIASLKSIKLKWRLAFFILLFMIIMFPMNVNAVLVESASATVKTPLANKVPQETQGGAWSSHFAYRIAVIISIELIAKLEFFRFWI